MLKVKGIIKPVAVAPIIGFLLLISCQNTKDYLIDQVNEGCHLNLKLIDSDPADNIYSYRQEISVGIGFAGNDVNLIKDPTPYIDAALGHPSPIINETHPGKDLFRYVVFDTDELTVTYKLINNRRGSIFVYIIVETK